MKLPILVVLILMVTTCAEAQKVITIEQMSQMARLMTGSQIESDHRNSMVEDLSRDNVAFSDPGIWDFYKSRMVEDTAHVTAVLLEQLSCKGPFEVLKCFDDQTNDGDDYIIAFGYDGDVFPLGGFGRDYFEQLIKSKGKPIQTAAEARLVAEFYLETVLYTNMRRTILNEIDFKRLELGLPGPITSDVIASPKGYRVVLVTKTESPHSMGSREYELHTFDLGRKGKVDYREKSLEVSLR